MFGNFTVKQKKTLLSGLFFAAFGVFVMYNATKVEVSMNDVISSATLPYIVGALVSVCGLIVIVSTLLAARRPSAPAEQPAAKSPAKGKFDTFSVVLGFACFIFYAAFFKRLGFIASSVLFLFSLTNVMAPGRPTLRKELFWLALSIAIPVAVFGIFVHLLNVPLPDGLIWF